MNILKRSRSSNKVQVSTYNMAEIFITYKNRVRNSEMIPVKCSKEAESYLRKVWSDRMQYVEEFMILCLNRANKVLGHAEISRGGIHGTVADPKVIFQAALKANACSIILAHNHPSGNADPSEADIALTKKLQSAGDSLDITLLDHIIITAETYYSFADEGLI